MIGFLIVFRGDKLFDSGHNLLKLCLDVMRVNFSSFHIPVCSKLLLSFFELVFIIQLLYFLELHHLLIDFAHGSYLVSNYIYSQLIIISFGPHFLRSILDFLQAELLILNNIFQYLLRFSCIVYTIITLYSF